MMKRNMARTFFIALLGTCSISMMAQVFDPTIQTGFAIEVSLENTDLKRMPIYRNAISSLKVINDYIIGGTSANEGLSPFIFVASLSERKLIHLRDLDEVIRGQQSIKTGFSRGRNNALYAGTAANRDNNAPGGGHLIQVTVGASGAIAIRDLGIPIAKEDVFSLVCNARGTILYGISYPSGIFFSYNIESGQTRTFKQLVPTAKDQLILQEHILKPEDYLCRSLAEDNKGLIYGSFPINKLFYFDPKTDSFHVLKESLPAIWGLKILGRVDAWAKSGSGHLFGGNAGDGQLFQVDPYSKKVKNLGKPVMTNRIRGLTFGKDGKLYGVGGEPPGYAHLFSYDLKDGYLDFGNPQFNMVAPGIEQGIGWRAYNIAAITASEDGKYIVMGEDEALSQLLIFTVPVNK